jgi:glycosyltransferase involved in cell wall biosynthesis
MKIGLVVHGSESSDKGGPSIRGPRTAQKLQEMGHDVIFLWYPADVFILESLDLVHIFNIWPQDSCNQLIRFCKFLKIKTILSPILMDHTLHSVWDPDYYLSHNDLPNLTHGPYSLEKLNYAFHQADQIVFLSEAERQLANNLGLSYKDWVIIYNPADTQIFTKNASEIFLHYVKNNFGKSLSVPFVLSVGRIEPRKNTLNLINSLHNSGIDLVLIGHAGNISYANECRVSADENTLFLDRICPGSNLLVSAYSAASVYVQISWAEGASLATLEAASTGCSLVLSDIPTNIEYYGPLASYASPSKLPVIRKSIMDACENASHAKAEKISFFVKERYDYNKHCFDLINVYTKMSFKAVKKLK